MVFLGNLEILVPVGFPECRVGIPLAFSYSEGMKLYSEVPKIKHLTEGQGVLDSNWNLNRRSLPNPHRLTARTLMSRLVPKSG